ncbi:MAG: HYR domain-containing protein [Saprospirales bacterium]|nr:HYR domain-containing protein [Saprospirales bacterium]
MNNFYPVLSKPSVLSKSLCLSLTGLLSALFLTATLQAQVNVTATGGTLMASYPTVAAAVAAINGGTHTGTITVDVPAGHTETTDIPEITFTGTALNPITIQKSGVGANPVITRLTAGTVASTTTIGSHGDGIIVINGGDYITFDGIDIATDPTFSGSGFMEYGYYLKKASATDACKNVVIKNCAITLNKAAIYSYGVFVSNISGTASVTVTSTGGRSENINIFNNTISNAYGAVQLRGYAAAAPYDFYDQNIEVGDDGGNMITNFGGGASTVYVIYTIYQNNCKLNNNTITGGDGSTSALYGIYITTSNNGSYDINNNNITLTSNSTTSQLTGIYTTIGTTGNTSNTININGNTLTGFSRPSATSGITYFIYSTSNYPFNFNINNNTIGNSSLPGTGTVYGIYQISIPTNMTINGNVISGITREGTTSTSLFYGISTTGSSTSHNATISNNTIHTLTGNGSSGAVGGISLGTVNVANVFKNKIYNISSNNASGVVYGIAVSSVTTANIYNNLIGDLNTPSTGSSTATNPTLRGINITSTLSTSNINLSYNTVYLDATSTGTDFGSAALVATGSATSTTASLTLLNNLFVNVSTPAGVGRSVAYQRSNTSLDNYNAASNNNLFYAGTPGASNLIFYDGTNADETLAAFKVRVAPREANSITENPTFLSASGASADFLHISTVVPTQIESGGVNVTGITDDYDGNTRQGNPGYAGAGTAPDMGADEGNFIGIDLTPPNIVYTPLEGSCTTGDATIAGVNITDASGIPTVGALIPRIYYRKNAGAWFSQPGVFLSGTANSSMWNFTIVALDMGGLAVGDMVEYYLIAQDVVMPANIGSNPPGAVATDVNTVSTPPGTPNSFSILPTLSGMYTVGAGGDFTTLTEAVAEYNTSCLTGPVVFSLTDATYPSETFPIIITEAVGASAINTLTIRPAAGVNATISGNATALIKLDGADFIIIDGSNNGTNSRNLSFINASTSSSAAIWVASLAAGAGATNNTIKNLIIEGGIGTTSNIFGIASKASSSITTTGNDNDNLLIQNNAISKVYTGISALSVGTAGATDGLIIIENEIGSADPAKYLANRGIEVSYSNAPVISKNRIFNIITTSTNAATGIDINAGVIGGNVVFNNISTVYNTNTGGWNAYGIYFSSSTGTTNVLVANNFISDIKTVNYSTTSSFNAFGIRISGGTNLKIYNNSIHQYGDVTVASSAGMSANIYISSSAATGLMVRNNILSNTQSFGVAGSFVYNIFISFSGYSFAGINNNDYYGAASANTRPRVGYGSGTIYTTLADWQAFTTQDGASVAVQPNFVSDCDLHLTATNNQCLDGGASIQALVTMDYDMDVRDSNFPDIGADEFSNPTLSLAITETSGIAANDGITCSGDFVSITAAGGGTYAWSNGDNTATTNVSPLSTTTYTVTITHANTCTDQLLATITANQLPTAYNVTGGGAYCAPGSGVPVGLSGSDNGVNYQLQRDGNNVGAPVAGTGAALSFGNQATAGSYTVQASDPSTACSAAMSGSASVEVNAAPVVFNVTGGGAYCAPGGVPVGLSGSEIGVDYQLQLNGSNAGAPVAGTGIALSFGNQASAGTYTVIATATAGACTAAMSGSAVVTVNESPTLSETHVEPSPLCTSTNGSIDLTVTGGVGPFSYNWSSPNGTGLVNGQQDQSGLSVGTFFVTVTGSNTCSATLTTSLIGPGGCDACPVIASLGASPTGVCVNEPVTLTASGLVDMGITYGITFKYSTVALADPYNGGTVIATVPNANLTNNFTVAQTTTSFASGNTYFIYAILDQTPADPACRPFAQTTLPVVNIPNVNAVANQTVCNGSSTAAINFSGSVAGTEFNWTNNNTSIGLAAAGTGDIASFAAVNNGTAPVTATITVTPVTSASTGAVCTGAPIQITITVNPVPTVNAVASPTYCVGSAVPAVVFTSNVPGAVLSWSRTNEAIGLGANSGTGNVPAFTAANAGTTPLTSTFSVVVSFTNNGVTCTGTPIQFDITVNPTPTVAASTTSQTVCNGSGTTAINFTGAVTGTVFNWTNNNSSIGLAAIGSGNIGSFTAVNNGGAPVTATITVTPTFTNNGITCSGTPVNVTITVNPTAQVNQPASFTTCGGATTTVNFTTTTTGTTYSWTNSNTAIGLAASGTGNISFVAANVLVSTSATLTVTPNYTNNGVSCPGTPKTFTITVDPLPTVTVTAGNNQVLCSGESTAAITFSGTLAGTVFNWTNSNPSVGLPASGSGNIASFVTQNSSPNVQVATITVTPVLVTTGGSCPGTPAVVTLTVYPRPVVNAGVDQAICQNQVANLTALLSGGATGGTWSGGTGTYGNKNSATTTYTPAAGEYGTTITLTFTSNDPAGPCPAVSDAFQLTINTLPLVFAGNDLKICDGDALNLSVLNASIQDNGSGVTTGTWTTSGTGTFQPSASFPGATTYVPGAADYAAGFVILTLTSADPAGPCGAVSDQVRLGFKQDGGIVCNNNVQVSLDEDGLVEVLPDMVLEGTYDDEFFSVTVYQNSQSIGNTVNCTHVGKTLQVRVTDNCTNNFCWGTIKIEDKLAPKLTCKDIHVICAVTNYTPAYLQTVLGLANVYPAVEENCPPAPLTYVDEWFDLDCDDDYSARIRRVWTATDASGNQATCVQNIYFDRKHVGDVLFPTDVTISCSGNVNTDPSNTGAPYLSAFGLNWPLYPGAGNCEMQTAYVDQLLPVCEGTYKLLRTWTVYDWCLPTSPYPPTVNPQYYIQVIKVLDEQGPSLACPANLTVSTDPFNCCGTPNLPDIIVEDACSRINAATARVVVRDPISNAVLNTYDVDGSPSDFAGNNHWDPDTLVVYGNTPCLPLGGHTVTYTVEDACGNTTSCTFRLTVEDQTVPVPACDEFTQVSLGINGEVFIDATTFDDGSYDNCSAVSFKARRMSSNSCQSNSQFYDQVKFCCSDINDTITVVLRVYDVAVPTGSVSTTFEEQNSNDCMVQVFVDDKLKPTCIPPAPVTVSCENFDPSLWAYGFATSNDNCCVDTITATTNYGSFDTLCNKGTITRTFRAFDCGGLSNQCSQRIIVNYEQDYYIKFPNDQIVSVCDGTGNYGEPIFFGEDCELLGVSYEDEVFTVVPDACYKIERTWTIINWCTYNPNAGCINVPNPNPNAITNHPTNLPGPTVSACGTPAPWNPTVVKINPTDPQSTNYCTFWDANANCYKYKQIIKVIDTQDPVVQCPASPVEVCDLTPNDPLLWNQMYWFDNTTGSHDLCEAPTDLCITATDLCSGANLEIRYLMFLDLDGDGTMETVINSVNTGIAGLG